LIVRGRGQEGVEGGEEEADPGREASVFEGIEVSARGVDSVAEPVCGCARWVVALRWEVRRFKDWAASCPNDHRSGEWECDYGHWGSLYSAVLEFIRSHPVQEWDSEATDAVLYVIARDNEMEYLAEQIRENHPVVLLALAEVAVRHGERDAKWQLADQLSRLSNNDEVERMLLLFAGDGDEYVRRRALRSLLRIGSAAVEQLALDAWSRPHADQEWSRMMALYCLWKIKSSHAPALLALAERDARPYLAEHARKIIAGTIENEG